MKDENAVSRRNFIQRLGLMGTAGIGAGSLLAACGGGEQQPAPTAESDPASESAPAAEPAPAAAAEDACADLSGLTEAEVQMRTNLQYVAQTANPEQRCDNCALWVAPEGDAPCGSCNLIKGPINPAGYCISWAAVQA